MGKNKLGAAAFLSCLAGVLAVVAAILYKDVMYTFQPVYVLLIAAVVLAVLGYVVATKAPKLSGYVPVVMAVLLASAAVWGTQLMVNQLGYVYAGLDGVNTIMSYIYFVSCTAVAMVLSIVASFLPMAKAAQ